MKKILLLFTALISYLVYPTTSYAGVISEIVQYLTAMHAGKAASQLEINWLLLLAVIIIAFVVIVVAARIKASREYRRFLNQEAKKKQNRKDQ